MEHQLDFATGSTLTAQTDAAIEQIKREAQRRKPTVKQPEPSDHAVIKALTDAAMPAVKNDARALQRVTAENELYRRKAEQAWALQRMAEPQEF